MRVEATLRITAQSFNSKSSVRGKYQYHRPVSEVLPPEESVELSEEFAGVRICVIYFVQNLMYLSPMVHYGYHH
jgi:hypothetical protein